MVVPAAAGFGIYSLLRKRLGEDPLGRLPSLALTKPRAIGAGAVLLVALAVVISPAASGRPSDAPHVLIVSIDTLRADDPTMDELRAAQRLQEFLHNSVRP